MKLYNSMSKELEKFVPADERRVTMYVCGPTVYQAPHIGNLRPAVVFDTLYRYLRDKYGRDHVVYASNFTDIDDKIIKRANDNRVGIKSITDEAIEHYQHDLLCLNVLNPNERPFATKYVDEMIRMIDRLQMNHYAYEANGNVWFSVPDSKHQSFQPDRSLEDTNESDFTSDKQHPADFALWKAAKPGEPFWESPWGPGRPGWHIECSAMIHATLGESIDIHGGGSDLMFPHHEAENAQSTAVTGKPLARYWLHNGMMNLGMAKISKSIGNTIYMRDLNSLFPGESIRFFLMMTHYRSTMNFEKHLINDAHGILNNLYRILYRFRDELIDPTEVEHDVFVVQAIEQDLNTAGVITRLQQLAAKAHKESNPKAREKLLAQLIKGGQLLGVLNYDPEAWFHTGVNADQVEQLISNRNLARAAQHWEMSDNIRKQLNELGVTVDDLQDGTFWKTIKGDVRQTERN
ncbi:Cysteine--tRNA ligase [compost metagenome]